MILTIAHPVQGAPPLVSVGAQAKMSYVKPRRRFRSGAASMATARAGALALIARSF